VKAGDTLSAIAKKYYGDTDFQAIYEANKELIGADPNDIKVGMVLVIPKK
jgi:nucleoid-associated protein YgaU